MMGSFVKSFWSREEGATAVEYGLMVALIAAVIVASVTAIGTTLVATFTGVEAAVNLANP